MELFSNGQQNETLETMFSKKVKSEDELRILAEQLFGEGKECEKGLFIAASLFLIEFCPPKEQNAGKLISLIRSAIVNQNSRRPISDFDKIIEEVKCSSPTSKCLVYYDVFRSCSHPMRGQAVAHVLYRFAQCI